MTAAFLSNSARLAARPLTCGGTPTHQWLNARLDASPLDASSITDACDLRADLRPGDVLFIPEGWWHYVVTPVTSVSVSVWF